MLSAAESAAMFAERGWAVFPVQPHGKVPLTGSGYKDASTGPKRVEAWWRTFPDANIGVACGASDLVVIDLDYKPDQGVNGLAAFSALALDHLHGELPVTPTALTPSGGRHLYFRAPAGVEVRNSASKLGPGIDVRGVGGYVVAPPSSTETGEYEFLTELVGDDDSDPELASSIRLPEDPAPLPEWLLGLLVRPEPVSLAALNPPPVHERGDRYAQAALDAERGRVACAAVGQRNDVLNTAAYSLGTLVGARQLDARTVAHALSVAAERAGLTEAEYAPTIASGIRAGVAHPRTAR